MMTVQEVTLRAHAAEEAVRETSTAGRIAWLNSAADALADNVDLLVEIAGYETHLDEPRLRAEMVRTTAQLRFFGDVIADGHYLEVIIDHADAAATPPRPDLRRMLRPIGPVAVFAASNFPFAFSVAGGDTASALAAGCPVVVKAHPGHPETSRETARILFESLDDAGAPEGAFDIVEGLQEGVDLAGDQAIKAVAFTGSLRGGKVIQEVCSGRPDPVPFYGELGSLNPVVVTVRADLERGANLVAGLVASFTLGVGQFCTKPGLVILPTDSTIEAALPSNLPRDARPMLHPGIAEAYHAGMRRAVEAGGVEVVSGSWDQDDHVASPVVLATDIENLMLQRDVLLDEVFGPTTLLVRYRDIDQVGALLGKLTGSLTATIHAGQDEDIDDLVEGASRIAGRVLFDGWPTGVAVAWAQHHGGPWPATTSTHTSVGATAIRRFIRPIVFQDAPPRVLPPELLEDNPLGIPRRVNGNLEPEPIKAGARIGRGNHR
jgi:NADP-dependent aldehyde dehydrogenase